MNHFQLARFSWILLLLTACTARPELDDTDGIEARRLKLPELSQEPLAPAVSLTADYFRQAYPHLTAEQFQQKWQNSHKSGLLFVRSYVNTWYDELGRMSSTGPIGPCFGDPHPENFGYLPFSDGFEYVYNDADDSGACPVIFDALRYFTSTKIMLKDDALEAELRRAYIRFLNGEELSERPSRALSPDIGSILSKVLSKNTKQGRIKLERGSTTLDPSKAQSLFALFKETGAGCKDCKLLDATRPKISSGGSAGLDRYWLLVETGPQTQQLIEFKALTEPASHRGPWARQKKLTRTAILEEIWGKKWPQYFAFVNIEGESFLMRSRVNADLDLKDLPADQKRAVLMEQVFLLAQLHKKTLTGNTLLEEWLGRQSEFQARRYSEALLAAQGG